MSKHHYVVPTKSIENMRPLKYVSGLKDLFDKKKMYFNLLIFRNKNKNAVKTNSIRRTIRHFQ